MPREHPPVTIMRSDLSGRWYAVRERNGRITDKWPIAEHSELQLEAMRDAAYPEPPVVQTNSGQEVTAND